VTKLEEAYEQMISKKAKMSLEEKVSQKLDDMDLEVYDVGLSRDYATTIDDKKFVFFRDGSYRRISYVELDYDENETMLENIARTLKAKPAKQLLVSPSTERKWKQFDEIYEDRKIRD
jgi:hypothetical protein